MRAVSECHQLVVVKRLAWKGGDTMRHPQRTEGIKSLIVERRREVDVFPVCGAISTIPQKCHCVRGCLRRMHSVSCRCIGENVKQNRGYETSMAGHLYFNYAALTTPGNSWRPWERTLREKGVTKLAT